MTQQLKLNTRQRKNSPRKLRIEITESLDTSMEVIKTIQICITGRLLLRKGLMESGETTNTSMRFAGKRMVQRIRIEFSHQ